MPPSFELTLSPRRAAQALLAAAAAVTIFTFIGKLLTIYPKAVSYSTPNMKYLVENYFILQFRLNTASNMVVYFTSFILLAGAALLLFLIALYKNSIEDNFKRSWFALAALVFFLSVYSSAYLPDKHIKFYYSSWTTRNGWFEFRWQLTAVLLILLAILFRKFWAQFKGKEKKLIPISILLYYAGVFGVELFSPRYASFYPHETLLFALINAVAEFAMFGGIILLLYALLHYLAARFPIIEFSTTGRESPPLDGAYAQTVHVRRILWTLVIISISFGALSFIGQMFRLFPNFYSINTPLEESLLGIFIYQFGVNTEANLATYFNTLLLLLAAALLVVIALLKKLTKDKYRWGWLALSLFVLYLSIDEQCVLHEKLNKVFSGWSNYNGWLEYRWLIPALIGMAILAALLFPFFLHLDRKFKMLFVLSALMFFGGAFGGEMFSGRWASVYGVKNITYSAMTTIEELLELNGINLLIYSLLHYLEMYFGKIRLKVGEKN